MRLTIALVCIFGLVSCEKNAGPTSIQLCNTPLKLVVDNPNPTVGETVTITANKQNDLDIFKWTSYRLNEVEQQGKLVISDIGTLQSGWYYCKRESNECYTYRMDSVYIDVKLKQETPPCTPVNNEMVSSSIPGVTFTTVRKQMDPTYNGLSLQAYGGFGYPSFTVIFNSYMGNTEPADGLYTTTMLPVFDLFGETNTVSVSFVYASAYWHCQPGQKLYVAHVNGKLQVTFCDLPFSSSPWTTRCSAKMTEL